MKAYLLTTGGVFSLITVAHIWRMIAEGSHLGADSGYLLITTVAAGLGVWAWLLLRRSARS